MKKDVFKYSLTDNSNVSRKMYSMSLEGCTEMPNDRTYSNVCRQMYSNVCRSMSSKVFGQLPINVCMQLKSNICRLVIKDVCRQMFSIDCRNIFRQISEKGYPQMSTDNCIEISDEGYTQISADSYSLWYCWQIQFSETKKTKHNNGRNYFSYLFWKSRCHYICRHCIWTLPKNG